MKQKSQITKSLTILGFPSNYNLFLFATETNNITLFVKTFPRARG